MHPEIVSAANRDGKAVHSFTNPTLEQALLAIGQLPAEHCGIALVSGRFCFVWNV